jgi:CelD/BcsL family acetyltransferase involved in cellulose biosynthesis
VFVTPEWLLPWWNVFRSSFALRVLTGWDGDRLVGLMPCFLAPLNVAPIRLTRMRMMGEHSVLGEYAPVVEPDYRETFVQAAAAWCSDMLRGGQCDLVDFHQFREGDPVMEGLAGSMKALGLSVRYAPENLPRVGFPAPPDWEGYRKMISYNERGFLGRRERLLARSGAQLEAVTTADDRSAVDDFVRLHAAAWADRGEQGFFRGREGFEEFHREALPLLLAQGFARFYFYRKDGVRFAVLLVYFLHGKCSLYLSGRDPHHELARHSPGRVLMSLVIREAIKDRIREIDLMQGTTDYKFRIGGRLGWYGRLTGAPGGVRGVPARLAARALLMHDNMRARRARRCVRTASTPVPDSAPEK